jgi:hypothetical protein
MIDIPLINNFVLKGLSVIHVPKIKKQGQGGGRRKK